MRRGGLLTYGPVSMGTAGGCYGFRVSGVEAARALLVDVPEAWPVLDLQLVATDGAPVPAEDVVGPERAALPLHGTGWMEIRRDGPSITYHLPEAPAAEEL